MFDKLCIELENDTVRYIYGSTRGEKINIRSWGAKYLPAGSFVNGKVNDGVELVRVLKALKKEIRGFSGPVYLTVNDGSFVTRPVALPIRKEKDIEKHLSIEVEQYLPIKSSDFCVSFRKLGKNPEEGGGESIIMVSAGPKESIENVLEVFEGSKLTVKAIDMYPNNICRLFKDTEEEDFAVVDMRRNNINITIFESKRFYMHSYLSSNIEALLNSYSADSGIPGEAFRQDYFYGSYSFPHINQDEAAMEESLQEKLSGVTGQVVRYLDYFNSRHFGKTVDNVYVIGEYGMLKGLRRTLEAGFNTRVTIGLELPDMYDTAADRAFLKEQLGYYGTVGMLLRGKRR